MNRLIPILASTAVLMLAGCNREDAAAARSTAAEELVCVEYNPKTGLLVSPATSAFIGLKTDDVGEAPVASVLELSGQVYQAASPGNATALASITLNRETAGRLQQLGSGRLAQTENKVRVLQIESAQTGDTNECEMLVSIDDPERTLRPGQFVTPQFAISSTNAVTVVPRQALLQTTEGNFVYAVNGQRYVLTKVTLGGVNQEHAEIVDGLYAGDRIVTRPVAKLRLAELQVIRGGKSCCAGH